MASSTSESSSPDGHQNSTAENPASRALPNRSSSGTSLNRMETFAQNLIARLPLLHAACIRHSEKRFRLTENEYRERAHRCQARSLGNLFGRAGRQCRRLRRSAGAARLLREPDLDRLGAVGDEAQQPFAFSGQGGAVLVRQRLEGFDDERRGASALLYLPGAAHEAVDEEGRPDAGGGEENSGAVLVGDDARAIGVREDQVVVIGDEAHGRGGV